MKFKTIKEIEDGLMFDVTASKDEVVWLINYAVESLMKEGIITLASLQEGSEITLREVSH